MRVKAGRVNGSVTRQDLGNKKALYQIEALNFFTSSDLDKKVEIKSRKIIILK